MYLLFEAVVHMFFLIAFNVFALNESARESPIAKIIVLFFCGLFTVREVLQFLGKKSTYFCDPFNYPDLGIIICCIVATVFSGSDV